MDKYAMDTMIEIAREALEERGYGASFGHTTEEGHRAFFVSDLESGHILAEIVVKVPGLSGSESERSAR